MKETKNQHQFIVQQDRKANEPTKQPLLLTPSLSLPSYLPLSLSLSFSLFLSISLSFFCTFTRNHHSPPFLKHSNSSSFFVLSFRATFIDMN